MIVNCNTPRCFPLRDEHKRVVLIVLFLLVSSYFVVWEWTYELLSSVSSSIVFQWCRTRFSSAETGIMAELGPRPRIQCGCTTNTSETESRMQVVHNSTCNYEASERGPGQKVITFSLYHPGSSGNKRESLYLDGLNINAKKMKKLYPGWVMRIYTTMGTSYDEHLCSFLCKNKHVDLCDARFIPNYGDVSHFFAMNWRFLPLDDPLVDIFVSRDLDSEVSTRERSAVAEWEASNKTFHGMRDHPFHTVVILGGMWGAKVSKMAEGQGHRLLETFFNTSDNSAWFYSPRGVDQNLLEKVYSDEMSSIFMAHDSYYCKYSPNTSVPFPTRRKNQNDFVGNYMGAFAVKVEKECPVECRPTYGLDWTFC